MKVLLIQPNSEPVAVDIENTLGAKQELVCGPIDVLEFADDNAVIVLNDEGMSLNLPINRMVNNHVIYGSFIICGYNAEGDLIGLSSDQISHYSGFFSLSHKGPFN